MNVAVYVIIGVVVVLLALLVMTFNGLVRLRNQTKNAWAQIDVQLKRRHDLIPNLVETVRGYMSHERETLEAVTNARNLAQGAIGKGVGEQAKAEGELGGALSRLLAVAENYPDLKANDREQDSLLAPVLQRFDPEIQQQDPDVPLQCDSRYDRFQSRRVLRDRGSR
jgi:LemA protein